MTKVYFICEEDVADHSDIIHSVHLKLSDAEKELEQLQNNPRCEIPFYLMQADAGTLYVVPFMPTKK